MRWTIIDPATGDRGPVADIDAAYSERVTGSDGYADQGRGS